MEEGEQMYCEKCGKYRFAIDNICTDCYEDHIVNLITSKLEFIESEAQVIDSTVRVLQGKVSALLREIDELKLLEGE